MGRVIDKPTLTEALAARGFTHRKHSENSQKRDIVAGNGEVVATLSAHEGWEWLRLQTEVPARGS